MVERKGCHDDETEMVPWQHSGSGNSIEMPVKRKCDGSESRKDGGVIPDTRFPRVDGMANEGRRVMTTRTQCKRGHHIRHAFVHGGWSGSYTFQGCISRRNESVQSRGSRHSRDGRGSSGTRLGEGLDAFDVSEGDGRGTWR